MDVSELAAKKFETDRRRQKIQNEEEDANRAVDLLFFSKSVIMACSYDYGLAMDAGSTYVDG